MTTDQNGSFTGKVVFVTGTDRRHRPGHSAGVRTRRFPNAVVADFQTADQETARPIEEAGGQALADQV